MTLQDLACARIRNTDNVAEVSVGDMITIVAPWIAGENYHGLVTKVEDIKMTIYHGKLGKKITWSRYVKCRIDKV
tara:strand:+ start:213 stop:437 length:225 start_codon:yes stop_codon:yes gene_type:complete